MEVSSFYITNKVKFTITVYITGIAYEFCCLPIFRILARLTFQVYIWHITILFMISGSKRQPYYVNYFYLVSLILRT